MLDRAESSKYYLSSSRKSQLWRNKLITCQKSFYYTNFRGICPKTRQSWWILHTVVEYYQYVIQEKFVMWVDEIQMKKLRSSSVGGRSELNKLNKSPQKFWEVTFFCMDSTIARKNEFYNFSDLQDLQLCTLRLQNFSKNTSQWFWKLFIQNSTFSLFKTLFLIEMLMKFCRNFTNVSKNVKGRLYSKNFANVSLILKNFDELFEIILQIIQYFHQYFNQCYSVHSSGGQATELLAALVARVSQYSFPPES